MPKKLIETDYNKSAILKTEEEQPSLSKETTDALMHYGVLGMHWGVRRYQPYGQGGYNPEKKGKFIGPHTAGSIERKMNKAEKYVAKSEAKRDKYMDEAAKYAKKSEDLNVKRNRKGNLGPINRRLNDYYVKQMTYNAFDASKYDVDAERGKAYINYLTKRASDKGMTVSTLLYNDGKSDRTRFIVTKDGKQNNKVSSQQPNQQGYQVQSLQQQRQASGTSHATEDPYRGAGISARNRAKMMTNEELAAANKRLKDEQTYINMSSDSVTDGMDYYRKVANQGATKFINTTVNTAAETASKELVNAGVNAIKDSIKKKNEPSFSEKAVQEAAENAIKGKIKKEVNTKDSEIDQLASKLAKNAIEEYLRPKKKK